MNSYAVSPMRATANQALAPQPLNADSVVQQALCRLIDAQSETRRLLDELAEKLKLVLMPSCPQPQSEEKAPINAAPLIVAIDSRTVVANSISDDIRSLISRLVL